MCRRATSVVLLESEFGIVRVPNHPQWLGFRDVMTVNGKALARRDRRLSALFSITPGAGDDRQPSLGPSRQL